VPSSRRDSIINREKGSSTAIFGEKWCGFLINVEEKGRGRWEWFPLPSLQKGGSFDALLSSKKKRSASRPGYAKGKKKRKRARGTFSEGRKIHALRRKDDHLPAKTLQKVPRSTHQKDNASDRDLVARSNGKHLQSFAGKERALRDLGGERRHPEKEKRDTFTFRDLKEGATECWRRCRQASGRPEKETPVTDKGGPGSGQRRTLTVSARKKKEDGSSRSLPVPGSFFLPRKKNGHTYTFPGKKESGDRFLRRRGKDRHLRI